MVLLNFFSPKDLSNVGEGAARVRVHRANVIYETFIPFPAYFSLGVGVGEARYVCRLGTTYVNRVVCTHTVRTTYVICILYTYGTYVRMYNFHRRRLFSHDERMNIVRVRLRS